jgi:hypothetical protein
MRHRKVFAPLDKVGFIPHGCKGCWLTVIFGENYDLTGGIAHGQHF